MVSVFDSSVVDRVFIVGVMVSVLVSSVVDHEFIGGVMVSVLVSSVVDHGTHDLPHSKQARSPLPHR
jgi:hypothetical protein